MTDAFGIPKKPGERGFGAFEQSQNGALQGQSRAMYEAATNLVGKAAIALEGGHVDKAMGYVRRAEGLPYDGEGDGASPLSLAAHMYVLQTALEMYELGGGVWVEAADILLDPKRTWKPLAVADFRHVLTVVRDDYRVTQVEARQLRALIAGHKVATIREMQELAGEELCAVAIDLLELAIDYERRADAIRTERDTGH